MLNQCNFIGNLGADPEIRQIQTGDSVANFRIAVTKKWKGNDGQSNEKTEWVTIVAWKRLAEICGQYLRKGSKVYVSGELQTRKWQDKDGNYRFTTEIVASNIQFLTPIGEGGGGRNPAPAGSPFSGDGGYGNDVPF